MTDQLKQPIDLKRTAQSNRVARSASIASAAIFTSRITGLLRETVMAQVFGAGFSYDAYLLGFRIPNLTRDLFAEGALSAAFVPTFSATLRSSGLAAATRLANLVGTAIFIVVGALCVLASWFSPALVSLLAPGFKAVPGKFDLAVHLTRIMIPFLLLVSLSAQAMGVLNALDRFGVPAMASTFFNLGSVVFGLLIGFALGPQIGITPIEGMAYGVLLGGCLQVLWQLPTLRKLGFTFRPTIDWRDPGLRQISRMMAPAILGGAATQINVMVNTNFASQLSDPIRGPDGPVSWLAYAFRFMQLPLGLFGVSFAAAMLPSISRSAAEGNYEEFRKTLSRSLGTVFVLTVPSSVGLLILRQSIIGAIFQGGHFDRYDTEQTALALSCYAVGLFGYTATKLLSPAFYALSDARTPMVVSVSSVLLNYLIATLMLRITHLNHAALALSTSFVAMAAGAVLFERLRRRLGGIEGRYLVHKLRRVLVASLLMAGPVFAANFFLSRAVPASRSGYLLILAVCLPLGLLVFAAAGRMLGLDEISAALALLRQRLGRRGPSNPHARV